MVVRVQVRCACAPVYAIASSIPKALLYLHKRRFRNQHRLEWRNNGKPVSSLPIGIKGCHCVNAKSFKFA